ncbi:MAG: DsbC family protein [Burkholderiales bacterium]|nr:MAG: DsbC family protein [Burkholderiales bacterium]
MFVKSMSRIAAIALAAALSISSVHAAESDVPASQRQQIKAAVERNTDGKVTVNEVYRTPIPGFFEATSGLDVFYVDASGRYALVEGHLMDLKSKQDLTQARMEKVQGIDFSALPLNLAIKTVQGTGRRAIAVFEDPTCPVCKVLHKFIAQLPDVTVYTFVFPIVSPESMPISRAAWCSPNRAVAWEQAMSGNPRPGNGGNCDTSAINQVLALGEKLQVVGTPTVFLGNGRRLVGATPPDQFIQALNEVAPPSSN